MTPVAPLEPSHARRRAMAALHGGLLGAWWGLLFLILVRGSDQAWWMLDLPQAQLDRYFGYEHRFLPYAARKSGFSPLASLEQTAMLSTLLGASIGYLVAAGAQALRIDAGRESRRVLLEVAGSHGFLGASLLVPLALLSVAAFVVGPDWLWLASLVYAMAAPFFVLDRRWLSSPRSLPLPRPHWPGWRILLAAIVVWVVWSLLDQALEVAGSLGGLPAAVLLQIPSMVLGALGSLLGCAIWVDRLRLQSAWAQRRQIWDWRALSAFIALEVRFVACLLWFAGPLLAWTVASIYVLPQLEDLLARQGDGLPGALTRIKRWFDWWWIWIAAFTPALLALNGRLYVGLFPLALTPAPEPGSTLTTAAPSTG